MKKGKRKPEQAQHGKNRSRPRGWHRGVAAGRVQASALKKVERAERAEGRQAQEVKELAARGREETELWLALEHVAPFVPRFWL